MKRLLPFLILGGTLAFAVMLIALPAWAADLATRTPPFATLTPAATPSPNAISDADAASGIAQKKRYTAEQLFEAGLTVGTEAGSASTITFLKLGRCTVNLPAIAAVPTPIVGPPRDVVVWCTMTGAAVGDSVFHSLRNHTTTEYYGLTINSAQVIAANTIQLAFTQGSLAGLDPGPLVVDLLVLR